MADHLFVLLGAGASYDCTSGGTPDVNAEYRPPLVTQLFEQRPAFTRILQEYPLARAAAPDVRLELAAGTTAIEAFLRNRLRFSNSAFDRMKYWAIPLYLQHLFFQIAQPGYGGEHGVGYTVHADNYDRLVSATLHLPEVVFITLNYDTLLERSLFTGPWFLNSMESYIETGRNWSLVKLHGSVNWGRRMLNPPNLLPRDRDPYLAQTIGSVGEHLQLSEDITLRPQLSLRDIRVDPDGRTIFYPALSAPLGSEDEVVCPPSHVQFLRERLTAYDGINLLVVGYSGLDQEVRTLLRESGNTIRSLFAVNGDAEAGHMANRLIRDAIAVREEIDRQGVQRVQAYIGGFEQFAQSANLPQYIESLP
jgi:hypothetical protein